MTAATALETEPAERRKLLLSLFARYGHKTARSSPYSHTTTSCPTSKRPNKVTNTTQTRGGAEGGSDGGRTLVCCLGD